MTERIFLIGFMGSGKSTIGERLAQRIGWQFIDTDRLIETTCATTISQIFAQQGENAFRAIERAVLAELLQRRHIVVATGGGLACQSDNMAQMNAAGTTIYLKTPAETLFDRLKNQRNERPLLVGKDDDTLRAYIADTLQQREAFYSQAQLTVATADAYPQKRIDLIINYLQRK